MSRCCLSLLYPSQQALLSGIAGSTYPPLTYVLLPMQESLQKIHSNGPRCRGGERENGFSCWCFPILSLNQSIHATNRCINASSTGVFWRLVIPPGSLRLTPKFISSELVEIFWITLEKQKDIILWNNVYKQFFHIVWAVYWALSTLSVQATACLEAPSSGDQQQGTSKWSVKWNEVSSGEVQIGH